MAVLSLMRLSVRPSVRRSNSIDAGGQHDRVVEDRRRRLDAHIDLDGLTRGGRDRSDSWKRIAARHLLR